MRESLVRDRRVFDLALASVGAKSWEAHVIEQKLLARARVDQRIAAVEDTMKRFLVIDEEIERGRDQIALDESDGAICVLTFTCNGRRLKAGDKLSVAELRQMTNFDVLAGRYFRLLPNGLTAMASAS